MALTRIGLNQSINLASNVTGTLPIANGGTALTSGFVNGTSTPGKVLQIVQARPTTETSTTNSSFQATGTEVAITPSATSSKIFVLVTSGLFWANSTSSSARGGTATIYRDSTNLGLSGSGWMVRTYRTNSSASIQTSAAMSVLDSPSSTSELTYKCYIASTFGGDTIQWNSSSNDVAVITAMEIAG
jgi:hypothetical protein